MTMFSFSVDPSFWDGEEATVYFTFSLWRWELCKMQRRLARLVDAHFAPSRLKCRLIEEHFLVIFTTLYLEVKGNRQDIDELGRLLEELR